MSLTPSTSSASPPSARDAASPAVETRALRRTFRVSARGRKDAPAELEALGAVDLRIERGEIFGLLGPNGAGKTTCIKILTTLLLPTSGEARVAGFDVVRDAAEVRRRISLVTGGESSGYGILTVRECLWMFSQFYGVPNREAWARVDRLIDVVGLRERQHSRINRLSTGERQRMNFARGFVSEPDVLFLDEPSSGLDHRETDEMGSVLEHIRAERGTAILLCEHDVAFVERLANRCYVLDCGRLIAEGVTSEVLTRPEVRTAYLGQDA